MGLAGGPDLPDPGRCLDCGRCAEACPTGARQLVGRSHTVTELVGLVERDRPFYEESGGGVTFSGGEPFAQARFLLDCLEAMRSRAINTTVDTCGMAPRRLLLRAAAVTDLFLYDLKHMDPARHEQVVGAPLEPILENLRALDRAGAHVWLRMPLIPGYNDDRPNLEALGSFVAGLRVTRRVHLLPYHRFGAEKRAGLGLDDALAAVSPPSPTSLETAEEILRGFGLDVHVGG
jgi:pyruvate formate lyase activating enzyme